MQFNASFHAADDDTETNKEENMQTLCSILTNKDDDDDDVEKYTYFESLRLRTPSVARTSHDVKWANAMSCVHIKSRVVR